MSHYVVGLTGGIGSGKSTAADLFVELGAALVDTDHIARELTAAGGGAMPALIEAFGEDIADSAGALDRDAMRRRVFADPPARSRLESILHPLIRQLSDERCRQASAPYVILAVPLLVESRSYRERCDRIVIVDCPEDMQIERVMQRSGLAESEVRAIMAAQATRAQRLAVADEVIVNDADRTKLREQVAKMHGLFIQLSAEKLKANG